MAADEEAAAAKIQAMKRGNEARAEVQNKRDVASSTLWAAVTSGDAAALKELLPNASTDELALTDPSRGTALQAAIEGAKWGCAAALVGYDGCLGLSASILAASDYPLAYGGLTGETVLKLWQKIQLDKQPPANEEEEPKDLESEEYQQELVAELTAAHSGLSAAEAGYIVKAVTSIGFYLGGRGPVAETNLADNEFDGAQGYARHLEHRRPSSPAPPAAHRLCHTRALTLAPTLALTLTLTLPSCAQVQERLRHLLAPIG